MLLTNRVFIPGSARLLQVPAAINEQQQIQVVAGLKNYNYKRTFHLISKRLYEMIYCYLKHKFWAPHINVRQN